jgi:hypothetical protein
MEWPRDLLHLRRRSEAPPAKFQHQAAVKIEPENAIMRFTRRVLAPSLKLK